jgi:actin-related protein 2
LPDGQTVRVGQERFEAAEVLFQPHVMGYETLGISEAVHTVIHDMAIDLRLGMYQKVLLAGGTMMLPGISTRLEQDLRRLYCDKILKVRSVAQPRMNAGYLQQPAVRVQLSFKSWQW